MKKILINLYFLICISIHASAQCLVNGITTNPDKTIWENPPYDALYKKNASTNYFDWRVEHFPVSMTSFPYTQVTSPYYFGSTATALRGLAQGEGNPEMYDFYPQDGWELIRKNFGLKADGSPITNEASIGPYYILYNKYTGTLRVIGWTSTAVGFFPTVNVKIRFKDETKTSGLFAFYNTTAKPLDQIATDHATTPATLTGDPLVPFFADFKLAYDPCTCLFDSNLEVEFNKVQTMNIDLYGRLFATSVPVSSYESLVGTGNGLYGKNFLTSVFDNADSESSDFQQVTAGMLTYRTIEDLVFDYNLSAAAARNSEQLKRSLELMGSVLSLAYTGKGASKTAGKAISLLSDLFTGEPGVPSSILSVIQGEMALTGTIINDVDQSISIPLTNPGSLNSSNAVECCTTGSNYPMYNEALGVFALLAIPEISLSTITSNGSKITTFQLANPLKYMFNPAAKINLANSRIYTSFEAETTAPISGLNFFEAYTSYNSYSQRWVTKYASPPVPIESMLFAKMQFYGSNLTTPKLSVILDLEFQELNRLGKPNRSLMVLTFPTKIINNSSTPSSLITGYEENKTLTTATYNQTQTITVWEDVTITGNQTVSSSISHITITAGGEVVIQSGAYVGRRFILKAGTYPPNAFTSWIYPQAVDYNVVPQSSYDCLASAYKAKSSVPARIGDSPPNENEDDKLLSIYPNPANSKMMIKFYLKQPGNVEINIVDISGRVVDEVLNQFMEQGIHEFEINATDFSPGMHIVRFQSNFHEAYEKLIILK